VRRTLSPLARLTTTAVLAAWAAPVHAQDAAAMPRARLRLVYDGRADLESAPMPPVAANAPPGLALAPHLVPPGQWQRVCTGPCDTTVEPDRLYRVGGSWLYPSPPFRAPGLATEVKVDVDPGRKTYYWTGIALTLGGVAITVAAVLMALEAGGSNQSLTPSAHRLQLVTAFGGPILLVGGGVLWAQNRETVLGVSYY
jgi:hypothetical protein